jgi:hypothetical protein
VSRSPADLHALAARHHSIQVGFDHATGDRRRAGRILAPVHHDRLGVVTGKLAAHKPALMPRPPVHHIPDSPADHAAHNSAERSCQSYSPDSRPSGRVDMTGDNLSPMADMDSSC